MKKNKFFINTNRRLFNNFFISGIFFLTFFKELNLSFNKNKLKKIKQKNFVWLLNEND